MLDGFSKASNFTGSKTDQKEVSDFHFGLKDQGLLSIKGKQCWKTGEIFWTEILVTTEIRGYWAFMKVDSKDFKNVK